MSKDDMMREAEHMVRTAMGRLGHKKPDDAEVKAAAAKIVSAHAGQIAEKRRAA